MKDEEKAEEYVIKNVCKSCGLRDIGRRDICSRCDDYRESKQAYLDGLTEGRKEKWHDLRKDPNDLPKERGEYWCKWEDGTYCTAHYFEVGGFCDCTIAWCELPKYKED